ncbi:MAG TPA: DUF2628 domain-containing protein [Propylenella sp.]
MRAYTVHAPPDETGTPEAFAFVKDGFSWPALFVPILWILWHRLWLVLIGYIIFVLLIAWTGRLANEDVAAIAAILGGVLFALEANNLRRLSLDRRGWSEIGGAMGRNLEEAEMRFFEKWHAESRGAPDKGEAIARAAYPQQARDRGADQPILGLFPEPER